MDGGVSGSGDGKNYLIHPRELGEPQTRPTLFLVRHAESTGNQLARLQGSRIGGELSQRGQKQSEAAADYLFATFPELQGGKVHLASSPSSRALQTARPIADRLNCEAHLELELAELDFGAWSGHLVAHLENDPAYQRWKADPWSCAPPGGESLHDVQKRVCRGVSRLMMRAADVDEAVLVVTHFFPLMVLFHALIKGAEIRCDNASISRFEPTNAGWTATHTNEISHLRDVSPTPVRYV